MRIGFDIDGVLAGFIPVYQKLTIEKAHGLNLFEPGDDADPPCWNWPEFRGYSADTMKLVWEEITNSGHFWFSLPTVAGASTLAMVIQDLEYRHDVYFITSRPGRTAKRQTEAWLRKHLPYPFGDVNPTVLICSDKAAAAKAVKLDVYIDDNYDNIANVVKECKATRAYLLHKKYNVGKDMVSVIVHDKTGWDLLRNDAPGSTVGQNYRHEERPIRRVRTLGEMLDAELVNL